MSDALIIPPGTSLIDQIAETPSIAIIDTKSFQALLIEITKEHDAQSFDMNTKAGRDGLRSFVRKITTTRTGVERARLSLTEEWREKTSAANKAGKQIKETLEALEERLRKPLTDWENAELTRESKRSADLRMITEGDLFLAADTSELLMARMHDIYNMQLDPAVHQENLDSVNIKRLEVIESIKVQIGVLKQKEADAFELEQLRAARAERERLDAEKAEADKKARDEALAKEEREWQERLDREAIEAAAAAAREQALIDAQKQASDALAEQKRAHEAEIAEIAAKAEREKAEAQALKDKEESDAKAAADAIEKERLQRQVDFAHRQSIKDSAVIAFTHLNITEETAKSVVMAIEAGTIPNVTISF
jgi:hypothetical protein